MSSKKIYAKRKFLNKDQSQSAFILCKIDFETWKDVKEKTHEETYATLEIADCSRKITLDFHSDNQKEGNESLNKIRRLQQDIENFAQKLETHLNNVYTNKK